MGNALADLAAEIFWSAEDRDRGDEESLLLEGVRRGFFAVGASADEAEERILDDFFFLPVAITLPAPLPIFVSSLRDWP